jgi:hypothetical protein
MNCGLCGKAVCICVTGCCDGSTLLTLNIGIFGSWLYTFIGIGLDIEWYCGETEIDRLRPQENRNHSCEIRTHAQKNSKYSASYDQQLPVTTLTPQVLRSTDSSSFYILILMSFIHEISHVFVFCIFSTLSLIASCLSLLRI